MNLLLDMGLSPRTAVFLREAGYDAIHLRDQGLQRLPDIEIMRKAAAERRVVVTFDLDFPHLLALQRATRPSVVLIRLKKFTTSQLDQRLVSVLERYQVELNQGAIVVVDVHRERIRTLPVW